MIDIDRWVLIRRTGGRIRKGCIGRVCWVSDADAGRVRDDAAFYLLPTVFVELRLKALGSLTLGGRWGFWAVQVYLGWTFIL